MALALFRTLCWWMGVSHPLTLDGLVAYTLYLVFKEPDVRPRRAGAAESPPTGIKPL